MSVSAGDVSARVWDALEGHLLRDLISLTIEYARDRVHSIRVEITTYYVKSDITIFVLGDDTLSSVIERVAATHTDLPHSVLVTAHPHHCTPTPVAWCDALPRMDVPIALLPEPIPQRLKIASDATPWQHGGAWSQTNAMSAILCARRASLAWPPWLSTDLCFPPSHRWPWPLTLRTAVGVRAPNGSGGIAVHWVNMHWYECRCRNMRMSKRARRAARMGLPYPVLAPHPLAAILPAKQRATFDALVHLRPTMAIFDTRSGTVDNSYSNVFTVPDLAHYR
jgi:hypothetical protein